MNTNERKNLRNTLEIITQNKQYEPLDTRDSRTQPKLSINKKENLLKSCEHISAKEIEADNKLQAEIVFPPQEINNSQEYFTEVGNRSTDAQKDYPFKPSENGLLFTS